MERILGIDYGDRRIGVAISDPLGLTAQPLKTVINDKALWKTLRDIQQEYEFKLIVLGLPKDQHGNDSVKAASVRAFGTKLGNKLQCQVQYWDERFSTVAASRQLHEMGKSAKQQRAIIDTQAAMYILQGYLDQNR